jgi:hypothetical protein
VLSDKTFSIISGHADNVTSLLSSSSELSTLSSLKLLMFFEFRIGSQLRMKTFSNRISLLISFSDKHPMSDGDFCAGE